VCSLASGFTYLGMHRITILQLDIIGLPWVLPVSLTLFSKEKCHETFQSIQNLDRLPQDPFEKNEIQTE